MSATIAIIVWFLAATVSLVRPRIGAALIWPAIWLYPNSALYGTLPLNVRFDDLWVVFMFLLAVSYARGRGGGVLFWLAIVWAFSLILGNLAGLFVAKGLVAGGLEWQQIVKSGLKTLIAPMTVYVLTVFLQEERHVLGHLKAMGLAAAAAGILGIAMVHFPAVLSMFFIPGIRVIGFQVVGTLEMVEAGVLVARRAQGAVGTVGLAIILMNAALLALCMAIYYVRHRDRLLFACIGGVCLIGLGYTATRGAIGGLMGAILWGILFTRRRWALVAISLAGAAFLLAQAGLLERIMLRVTGPAGAHETPLLEGLAARFAIWKTFVENFSPIYLLTGMGMATVMRVAKGTAHNSYLGAFVYSGIVGVAVMTATVVRAWTLGRRLRTAADSLSQGLGVYLTMFLVGLLVYGIVAEVFQQNLSMQLLFAGMVLAEKRLAQSLAAQAGEQAPQMVSGQEGYRLAY